MTYYQNNCKEYIENTKNADMTFQYQCFEKYLIPSAKRILDLGFGSGRDSIYLIKKGYSVCSIDPTQEFCDYGKSIGLEEVHCLKAQEITYENEFDGIWACASLLHVPSDQLKDVFTRCYKALKENGIFYASFKHGSFEGTRNGRHFLDLTKDSIKAYFEETNFTILEMTITSDVRPDREDKWLNIYLKK